MDLVGFENLLGNDTEHFEGDALVALDACRAKVDDALEDCAGNGAAGAHRSP
jgi:hypothetical protein